MVLLWEAFCTVFSNDRPTILAELLNFLLCRRRHFTQAEKREAVASILYHKMDEFTMIRNPASHFWSCRAVSREFPDDQPENKSDGAGMVIWDLEESSAGPRGFVPRSEGSVIFFANHTLAIEPGTKVAEVVLLRVGNLSDEVGADLATVDGRRLRAAVTRLQGRELCSLQTLPAQHSRLNYWTVLFVFHTDSLLLMWKRFMATPQWEALHLLEYGCFLKVCGHLVPGQKMSWKTRAHRIRS